MRVFVLSLGCPKNLVDTERMLGYLRGVCDIHITDNPREAEVIIVNTCGFIEPAKVESIEAVSEAVLLKEKDPSKRIIVAGCLYERYRDELKRGFPEVDCFVGVHELEGIVPCVFGSIHSAARRVRFGLDPHHLSYLKISDGCSNLCSFCTIPLIKGPLRSEREDELVNEAYRLFYSGVRELCVIAQDTTAYMYDLGVTDALPRLLRKLDRVGFTFIRLMYTYPTRITDELIDTIASSDTIAHYLDIPIQHISDEVLRDMGRGYKGEYIERLLDRIRAAIPDVSIRSTFIVGYPTERKEDFVRLKDFIYSAGLDWAGFFKYYKEEGTPSYRLRDKPDRLKEERLMEVEQIQMSVSERKNSETVGRQFRVIVDGVSGSYCEARSYRSAPEIDGVVLLEGEYDPGDVVNVVVKGVKDSVDVIGVKV